jgi:hypothetical protein
MKKNSIVRITATLALLQVANSCQLTEDINGNLTADQIPKGNPAALLTGVYNSMRDPIQGSVNVFALQEVSTDERIMPTRGPDWDDNGKWRQLYLHSWDSNNEQIRNTFTGLNGITYAATDLLRFNPTTQQAAEARFIRAWGMFWLLDMFDQVLYREPGEELSQAARLRKGTEALTYIVSEIQAVQKDLPLGPAGKANQDAAASY